MIGSVSYTREPETQQELADALRAAIEPAGRIHAYVNGQPLTLFLKMLAAKVEPLKRYRVYKQVTNDYLVFVDARNHTEARQKAALGEHSPGELTSEYNDGELVSPENWRVEEVK